MTKIDWDQNKRKQSAVRPPRESIVCAWWFVPAKFAGKCDECATPVAVGQLVAFNRDLKRSVCRDCAEGKGAQMSRRALYATRNDR